MFCFYRTEVCMEPEIVRRYKYTLMLIPMNPQVRTYYISVGSERELMVSCRDTAYCPGGGGGWSMDILGNNCYWTLLFIEGSNAVNLNAFFFSVLGVERSY